jgi:hypothetical protein
MVTRTTAKPLAVEACGTKLFAAAGFGVAIEFVAIMTSAQPNLLFY